MAEAFDAGGHQQRSQLGTAQPACYLACCHKNGQLGIAAYDKLSNELSVLQVADESKGPCAFRMLQYIKLQTDPQVLVLSATADPALMSAASAAADAAVGAAAVDEEPDSEYKDPAGLVVQLQRPSLFVYDKAVKMLSALSVQASPADPAGNGSSAAAAAVRPLTVPELVNMQSQQQVAALGALVAVLLQLQEDDAEGAGGCQSAATGSTRLQVNRLYEMRLEGHLFIDAPSMCALDVFKEEEHPSAMGIGTSKEGVSVYGLLQRCMTGMGRRLLRQWFLRPVVQLEVISDRHDTIQELVAAPHTNDALRAALKKLHDLPSVLARLRLSQARPQLSAFKQLFECISQLMLLRQMVEALAPAAAGAAPAAAAAPRVKAACSEGSSHGLGQSYVPDWLDDEIDGRDDLPAADLHLNNIAADSRRPHQQPAEPAAGWSNLGIVRKLLHSIGPHLAACASLIGDVIHLDCSLEGCLVQQGLCRDLDELKHTLTQLPNLLTQVVESELARVPEHVGRRYSKQLWSLLYIPQVGFVMSVSGGLLGEELSEYLPDFALAFMGEDALATQCHQAAAAAATRAPAAAAAAPGQLGNVAAAVACDAAGLLDVSNAYYYADVTRQLDRQYGDLQHKIQDLESSICTELIRRLLGYTPALTAASAAVAELDCLCGLAAAARELGYSRPTLTRDSVIHIRGGRHPLCELLAPGSFIPNNTHLGAAAAGQPDGGGPLGAAGPGGFDCISTRATAGPRMLLITGPNASGKSVYMKQVALLVYMAHVGSFVPAESALIGLTDRILTRLAGVESVGRHTSSFMCDLRQVSTILAQATSRSLVLLDEFGKGTLTTDGVALLSATLQHYAAQPCPPFVLACTHFAELLDPAVLPECSQMQHCTMQVLTGGGAGSSSGTAAAAAAGGGRAGDGQGQHVFLYKLVKGQVQASYGLDCARLCGVDEVVVARAADVIQLQQAGHAVRRLELQQLEQRDQDYWQLLQRLAGLDIGNAAAVVQLLRDVLAAEASVAVAS